MLHPIIKKLALILLTIIGLFALSNKTLEAQNQSGKMLIASAQYRQPVAIIEALSDKKIITLNEEFTIDDNWIQKLSFKVKNVSPKTITQIGVTLRFLNENKKSSFFSYPLGWGNHEKFLKGQGISILPNDTAIFEITELKYEVLRKAVEGMGKSAGDIKQVKLIIDAVMFDDDTMWRLGYMHRRDSVTPNKWVVIRSPAQLRNIQKISLKLQASNCSYWYAGTAQVLCGFEGESNCYYFQDDLQASSYGTVDANQEQTICANSVGDPCEANPITIEVAQDCPPDCIPEVCPTDYWWCQLTCSCELHTCG
ncbi:MAG: hypothetical protein HOP19_18625 [Acidobacteria bacterium]|nr:hypothetical protein [Acidobacteriota bacterium]